MTLGARVVRLVQVFRWDLAVGAVGGFSPFGLSSKL